MTKEEFDKKYPEDPWDHCGLCDENEKNGGHCKVADKYQRLPREYRGALAMCIKIGGNGS